MIVSRRSRSVDVHVASGCVRRLEIRDAITSLVSYMRRAAYLKISLPRSSITFRHPHAR